MKERIHLGSLDGEQYYLTKHEWACGWYWSFGWIGNAKLHTHFDNVFLKTYPMPLNCPFEENQWWVILDLFKQAYSLQKAAEVYRHGGHLTSSPGITDIIKNDGMVTMINADLEKVLNKVWDFMMGCYGNNTK